MSDKTEETPKKKKKGKGKLLMIGGALFLLVGGGVGGGLYAVKSGMIGGAAHAAEPAGPKLVPKTEQKRGGTGDGADGEKASTGKGETPPSGVGGDRYASNYYAMDKEFTSNLRDSVHFVQLGLAVSTPYDDSVIENLKTNEIAVRSAILMTLGDATEDQVYTSDGKRQLQRRIVDSINDTLKQKEGFGGVSNVYFTTFVVQ